MNVVDSSGVVEVVGSNVTGAVDVAGGTGPAAEIAGNHVTGALVCSGNTPAPTDGGQPNVAVARTGQCGASAF